MVTLELHAASRLNRAMESWGVIILRYTTYGLSQNKELLIGLTLFKILGQYALIATECFIEVGLYCR